MYIYTHILSSSRKRPDVFGPRAISLHLAYHSSIPSCTRFKRARTFWYY